MSDTLQFSDTDLAIVRHQKIQDILDAVVAKEKENIDYKGYLDSCLELAEEHGMNTSGQSLSDSYSTMADYLREYLTTLSTDVEGRRLLEDVISRVETCINNINAGPTYITVNRSNVIRYLGVIIDAAEG